MKSNSREILEREEEEILRVREVRHRLSERSEHDPRRLVTHLLEQQELLSKATRRAERQEAHSTE